MEALWEFLLDFVSGDLIRDGRKVRQSRFRGCFYKKGKGSKGVPSPFVVSMTTRREHVIVKSSGDF